MRKVLRELSIRVLKGLTRVPLPGFSRVYCADPNFSFLGIGTLELQWRGLLRGIQVIIFPISERSQFLELEQLQSGIPDVIEMHRNLEPAVAYSLSVAFEAQLYELPEKAREEPERKADYLQEAAAKDRLFRKHLSRFKPHLLVLAQGYGIEACLARAEAAKKGTPILAFENTAMKDRLVWEPISGVTVNRNIAGNLFWRMHDFVDMDKAKEFCTEAIGKTKANKQDEHKTPERQWKGTGDRPMILFLGQVYTDSSLLFGIRNEFGPERVVSALLDWCEAHDTDLVLKLHPKEATGKAPVTHQPYRQLTQRKLHAYFGEGHETRSNLWIDQDNSWDTYGLIQRSNLVVTINSQAGLESAIRGKPVITCGRCFYAGHGFTEDVQDENELGVALSRRIDIPQREIELRLAMSFFYIFFDKYCVQRQARALLSKFGQMVRSRGFFPGLDLE
jgi:hypothetical protein